MSGIVLCFQKVVATLRRDSLRDPDLPAGRQVALHSLKAPTSGEGMTIGEA
jgi:hypothetical protein